MDFSHGNDQAAQELPARVPQYFASAHPRSVSPMVAFQCPPPKKSMSFLSIAELVSYKTVPILGACAYISSSVAILAWSETLEM